MSKCGYENCPYETCGKEFCYFHEKVMKGEMKVYLTEEEIDRANLVWNRTTPPWVGLKRESFRKINGEYVKITDLIDVDWRSDE